MSSCKFDQPEPYARTEKILVADTLIAAIMNVFLVAVHALRLALTVAAFNQSES